MSLPLTSTVLVAIGGLLGSVLRYWLTVLVQSFTGAAFPFGTLVVNVAGSLAIGVVMSLALDRGLLDDNLRVFLTTGFCGGFTTMSTFSYETLALARDGEQLLALGYVGATLATCLAAVWLGSLLGRLI